MLLKCIVCHAHAVCHYCNLQCKVLRAAELKINAVNLSLTFIVRLLMMKHLASTGEL